MIECFKHHCYMIQYCSIELYNISELVKNVSKSSASVSLDKYTQQINRCRLTNDTSWHVVNCRWYKCRSFQLECVGTDTRLNSKLLPNWWFIYKKRDDCSLSRTISLFVQETLVYGCPIKTYLKVLASWKHFQFLVYMCTCTWPCKMEKQQA